jgi:hypothetical protein
LQYRQECQQLALDLLISYEYNLKDPVLGMSPRTN